MRKAQLTLSTKLLEEALVDSKLIGKEMYIIEAKVDNFNSTVQFVFVGENLPQCKEGAWPDEYEGATDGTL